MYYYTDNRIWNKTLLNFVTKYVSGTIIQVKDYYSV